MADELLSDADLGLTSEAPTLSDADVGLDQPAKPERSWSDVPLEAVKNIPSSAVEFGKNIVQPFIHPIETATALKNLGHGVLQKTGLASGDENEQYADAVGKFFVDRYGSMDAVKKTLAEDPVGIAADLSILLTGGGAAAARAPGLVGQVGKAVGTVGRTIDPLTGAAKVVEGTAKGAGYLGSEIIGGVGTHTGGKSLRTAAEAGYEGGEAAKALRENMRGQVPMEEVVQEARAVIPKMAAERSAAYNENMASVRADKQILNFDKVDDALADITQVKVFHGVPIEQSTQAVRAKIGEEVQKWRALEPEVYHTPAGLDALKQLIGDVRDTTEIGTPARRVADQAYHAIRKTIVAAPGGAQYVKTMKGYEEASNQMRELEKALVGTKNTSIDTSLRKLQKALRNNVSTNYGYTEKLAAYLATHGSPQLMEKLAGQSLNAIMPRGLGKLQVGIQAPLAYYLGAGFWPTVAALPLASPRVMGEAAYLGGRTAAAAAPVAKVVRPAVRPAYQTERATEEQSPFKHGGSVYSPAKEYARRGGLYTRGGLVNHYAEGGGRGSSAGDGTGAEEPYTNPQGLYEAELMAQAAAAQRLPPSAPVAPPQGRGADEPYTNPQGLYEAGLMAQYMDRRAGVTMSDEERAQALQGALKAPGQTTDPVGYGIGPSYGASPEMYSGPVLDPGIWRGEEEPTGRGADAHAADTGHAGMLDYSSGSFYPANWGDYKYNNTSTGGGFFTLADFFKDRGVSNPYFRDADLPSTNNWRLIGRGPHHIMRNGVVIDLNSQSMFGPFGNSSMGEANPGWRSGGVEGVPVAYAPSPISWNVLGWPGGINGWFSTAQIGSKRGGTIPRPGLAR